MADAEALPSAKEVFQLSLCSNLLASKNAPHSTGTSLTLATTLAGMLPGALPSGWQVTWGPMIYKLYPGIPLGGPDLAVYIAQKSNSYVVAIAGTNPKSLRDINIYDGTLVPAVDWSAWLAQAGGVNSTPPTRAAADPAKPFVAYGTATAIHDLVKTGTLVGPSQGKTIIDYLKTLPSNSTLIYTGHSLGGALSPTLAFGLRSQFKDFDAYIYPSAGPSPGNASFINLLTSAFPARGGFNTNLINAADPTTVYDPVTCAWSLQQPPKRCMQYLFEIYGQVDLESDLGKWIQKVIDRATTAAGQQLVFAFVPPTTFVGKNKVPYKPPTSVSEYMADFDVTHVADYKTFFGLQDKKALDGIKIGFPLPPTDDAAELIALGLLDGDAVAQDDGKAEDGQQT